jgi:hypothetical protein
VAGCAIDAAAGGTEGTRFADGIDCAECTDGTVFVAFPDGREGVAFVFFIGDVGDMDCAEATDGTFFVGDVDCTDDRDGEDDILFSDVPDDRDEASTDIFFCATARLTRLAERANDTEDLFVDDDIFGVDL